jgi:hypothetical protein
MLRMTAIYTILLLVSSTGWANESVENRKSGEEGDKLVSGMSIVGNDEAPKSLVIVPWKSSQLGDTLDVSRGLGDGRQPVDRDVFMRALSYYQIRVGLDEPTLDEPTTAGSQQ